MKALRDHPIIFLLLVLVGVVMAADIVANLFNGIRYDI